MIPFNKPPYTGNEDQYVMAAMRSHKMSGDGEFTLKCQAWFENKLSCAKALLTPSCTQALEMAAILLDVKEGDEVIMPSFTFVSTANAFVLRGAKIVFVDIRPDTMNINEELIEAAITDKTVAIVVVHYAGVSCEMDTIMDLAKRKNIFVIEDAAQGMLSYYKGRPLGSIGHMAAYSFHETKNYTSGGEGGLLIINDKQFVSRAEIIREKGTNRSQFFRGVIDKYTWVDIGSSYLPGELQAAYLYGQLGRVDEISSARNLIWKTYFEGLKDLAPAFIALPSIPESCVGNAHMFYLKLPDIKTRSDVLNRLSAAKIGAVFHYVPLHSSPAGKELGRFNGADIYTTKDSERLIRLPVWFGMTLAEVQHVVGCVRTAVTETSCTKD